MAEVVDRAQIDARLEARPPVVRDHVEVAVPAPGRATSLDLGAAPLFGHLGGASSRRGDPDRVGDLAASSDRLDPAQAPAAGGRRVIAPVRIFSCRVRMAWRRVSGAGGHPGA